MRYADLLEATDPREATPNEVMGELRQIKRDAPQPNGDHIGDYAVRLSQQATGVFYSLWGAVNPLVYVRLDATDHRVLRYGRHPSVERTVLDQLLAYVQKS